MLKDDKSYPFIKITKERHPRLMITRQIKKGWRSVFWSLSRCGCGVTRPSNYWSVCILSASANCLRRSTVCIITWANVWPTGTRCLSLSDYDKMSKEVAQFLTGHDDKIVKQVQEKNESCCNAILNLKRVCGISRYSSIYFNSANQATGYGS